MNIHASRPDKYKRYRERKKAAGLKQVRIWTLDLDAPGFREQLAADQARLRAGVSERDTVAFIADMMADDLADENDLPL